MNIFIGSAAGVNTGDDAIQEVIVTQIKTKFPDANITVLTQRPKEIAKALKLKAISVSPLTVPKIFMSILKSDVVVIGGGTLIQDQLGLSIRHGLITLVSMLVIFAKMLRKPVILFTIGVEPLVTGRGRWCTTHIISKSDSIIVRDIESKQVLENLNLKKCQITVGADPAFLLGPCIDEKAIKILQENGIDKNPKFLVVVSVLNEIWGEMNHKRSIALACDYLIEKFHSQILFIASDYRHGEDMLAIKETIQLMKAMKDNIHILDTKYSPSEILGVIGQADLVLGMRMHILMFSAIMNIPFIAISRSSKVDNFLKLYGFQNDININNVSGQMLINQINHQLNECVDTKIMLKNKTMIVREKADISIKELISFIVQKNKK